MKIEGANININFYDDILGHLGEEEKIELAQMLCMDDQVLDYFVEKLMTDWASEVTDRVIHKARQRFIDLMPNAAAELIRALNAEVQMSKGTAEEYRERVFDIEYSYPRHVICPSCSESISLKGLPARKPFNVVSTPYSDKIMHMCGFDPVKIAEEEADIV